MYAIRRFYISEKAFFVFLTFLQVIPYWFITFIPSMDGPQHLHNSQVLNQVLIGNIIFQNFYDINPILVGYWTGHFLLSVFNYVFPAYIAEKLLITFYLIGVAFSFRYFVKSVSSHPSHLTVLIIPFSYTFYFLMGYYSFSLAFIFVFLAYGYYYRFRERLNLKNGFVLFLIISAIYLSHAFVFALFGFSLILFILLEFFYELVAQRSFKESILNMTRKAFILLIISLPAIIFFLIYIHGLITIDSTVIAESYKFDERLHFLFRIRSLIGFLMAEESYSNYVYWMVMLLVINYLLHRCFVKIKLKSYSVIQICKALFSIRFIWAHITIVFLLIYFFIPDRISAGNLVNRIAVFIFYFLAVWIASILLPKKLSFWLAMIVMIFFFYQSHHRVKVMSELSPFSKDVHALEQYIESSSIVFTYRVSSNWVDLHFLNYLGVDKPIINLGNPQCGGQFPVIWKSEILPRLMVGNIDVTNQYYRKSENNKNQEIINVEYVAVYRWTEFKASKDHNNFKTVLDTYYELKQVSPRGNAALFVLKK
jgi:hypothetical protein